MTYNEWMNWTDIIKREINTLYITLLSGGHVTRVDKYKSAYLIFSLLGPNKKTEQSLTILNSAKK